MPDFSQFDRLKVTDQSTALYRLFQLEGDPVLTCAPATEANGPYLNDLLKQSKGASRRLRATGVSQAALEQQRDDARVLFARHVVRGWSGVVDAKGAEVPFTVENCLAFLRAIPAWVFDAVQNFCTTSSNFTQPGTESPEEVEETAGN